MKKWYTIICVIGCVIFVSACGKSDNRIENNNTINDVGAIIDAEIEEEIGDPEDVVEDVIIPEDPENPEDVLQGEEGIDVDLTVLSSTMVYSEVYNMYTRPDSYIGKMVKMKGSFWASPDPTGEKMYYTVIIKDATECCAQGIEFELEGNYTYPDDYPEIEEVVTVVGEFETYYEDDFMYCRLKNAEMR